MNEGMMNMQRNLLIIIKNKGKFYLNKHYNLGNVRFA